MSASDFLPAVTTTRPVAAVPLPENVRPGVIATALPIFEWIEPTSLLIDEAYQRDLTDRSIRLIRSIVANWDWRRFKPPVVVFTDAGIEIIDGQHTAIAAACHPEIERIPVMVVEAKERYERAAAFLGHNRDRIAVTATQMHHAAVAAGDEDAATIAQVCARAGLQLLKNPPHGGSFAPGTTVAVAAIGSLINRRGAMKARQILEALTAADLAPVTANAIKAADLLVNDPEYSSEIAVGDIVAAIRSAGKSAEQEAKVFAAAHCVPFWKGLAIAWFKKRPRRRRALSLVRPAEDASHTHASVAREKVGGSAEESPKAASIQKGLVRHRLPPGVQNGSPFDDPPPGRSALDQQRNGFEPIGQIVTRTLGKIARGKALEGES